MHVQKKKKKNTVTVSGINGHVPDFDNLIFEISIKIEIIESMRDWH